MTTKAVECISSAIGMKTPEDYVEHFIKQSGKITSVFIYPERTRIVFRFSDSSFLAYTRDKWGCNNFTPIAAILTPQGKHDDNKTTNP